MFGTELSLQSSSQKRQVGQIQADRVHTCCGFRATRPSYCCLLYQAESHGLPIKETISHCHRHGCLYAYIYTHIHVYVHVYVCINMINTYKINMYKYVCV